MLTAEQIEENWDLFIDNLIEATKGDKPRANALGKFYKSREEDIATIPASSSINHHSPYPGGYVDHVNRVFDACKEEYKLWEKYDGVEGFTLNELLFAAIHHDLGKVGDMENVLYKQVNDNWRIEKGTYYEYNPVISYMSIPDRSIFLLNQIGVTLSENEFIAIKTHDGLYDEANRSYLLSPSSPRLKNNISYILHNADMLAARTEYHQFIKYSKKPEDKAINSNIKDKLNKV